VYAFLVSGDDFPNAESLVEAVSSLQERLDYEARQLAARAAPLAGVLAKSTVVVVTSVENPFQCPSNWPGKFKFPIGNRIVLCLSCGGLSFSFISQTSYLELRG
jgi:hypothetical protein